MCIRDRFQSFSIQPALDTDLALAEIPVKYSSDTDTLKLYPDNSMMTLLPSSGDGKMCIRDRHGTSTSKSQPPATPTYSPNWKPPEPFPRAA